MLQSHRRGDPKGRTQTSDDLAGSICVLAILQGLSFYEIPRNGAIRQLESVLPFLE